MNRDCDSFIVNKMLNVDEDPRLATYTMNRDEDKSMERTSELLVDIVSPEVSDKHQVKNGNFYVDVTSALVRAHQGDIPLIPTLFELLAPPLVGDDDPKIGWSKAALRDAIILAPKVFYYGKSVSTDLPGLTPRYFYLKDNGSVGVYDESDKHTITYYRNLYRLAYDTELVDVEKAINYGILDGDKFRDEVKKKTLKDISDETSGNLSDFFKLALTTYFSGGLHDLDAYMIKNNKPFLSALAYRADDEDASVGCLLYDSALFIEDEDEAVKVIKYAAMRFGTTCLEEDQRNILSSASTFTEDDSLLTEGLLTMLYEKREVADLVYTPRIVELLEKVASGKDGGNDMKGDLEKMTRSMRSSEPETRRSEVPTSEPRTQRTQRTQRRSRSRSEEALEEALEEEEQQQEEEERLEEGLEEIENPEPIYTSRIVTPSSKYTAPRTSTPTNVERKSFGGVARGGLATRRGR